MNIADILAPKPPPTIDAARVRTHLLGHDDDIPPKEKDMSRATDVADAIAKLGGRATREDLQAATGLEGKQMENGITCARTAALITRAGNSIFKEWDRAIGRDQDKIAPELQLSAYRALLAALQASELPGEMGKLFASVVAATASQADIEALINTAKDLLIVDGSDRIHLTQAQYIAVLNTKE